MSEDIQNEIKISLKPEVVGKIDLLIENGLYKDKISFLENAINQMLVTHQATIDNFKVKNDFIIGIVNYSAKELERCVADGKKLHIKVIGGLKIDDNVSPELADRAIEKINMAGIFHAPDPIKKVLANKQFSLLGSRRKLFLTGPSNNILDWNEENEKDSK